MSFKCKYLRIDSTEVGVVGILRDFQIIVNLIFFGHISEYVTKFTASDPFEQRLHI